MRSNERKRLANRSVTTRLKGLEKNLAQLLGAGKKTEAGAMLRDVASAYDKAVKSGVVHKSAANRKKSRLTLQLNKLK